jgi:hypothetical protein
LVLEVSATSTSVDRGDWQFKIADRNWGLQLTGTSATWGAAENEVIVGTPYSLGNGQETLYLSPAVGTYRFEVDLSDPAKPVLTVTRR